MQDIIIKIFIICLLAFTSGILDVFLKNKGIDLTYTIFFLNGYFVCFMVNFMHFNIERK